MPEELPFTHLNWLKLEKWAQGLDQVREEIQQSPIVIDNLETPRASREYWVCSCGVMNDFNWLICSVCESLKEGVEGWLCAKCKSVNSPTEQRQCATCEEPRHVWLCVKCSAVNPTSSQACCNCRTVNEALATCVACPVLLSNLSVQRCPRCNALLGADWTCSACNVIVPFQFRYCEDCLASTIRCSLCGLSNLPMSQRCSNCQSPIGLSGSGLRGF
jgi:hypothetical protein